ncbi:PD40 domain-containing protein [bacterium]|nr:PD40 domain-containing protein [bacterium]
MRFLSLFLVAALLTALSATAQIEGYYRHPDIHGNTIVFSAEGDLWLVSATGGTANRLTTNDGQETFPTFSPDGSKIAFQATYDGAADTYVIPTMGGAPKRISWDATLPVGWADNDHVLVRGLLTSGVPDTRLATVNIQTFVAEEVPLSQAAEGSFDAAGTLYFTRMSRQGSNSRWYKGGTAQKIWKYAVGAPEAEPLTTDYPGTSRQPNVLNDGLVYFLSDRQKAMNVWSMKPDGTDLQRKTDFEDMDIQELASDGSSLVFRLGADLWTYAPGSPNPSKLDIRLVSDLEQSLVDWETLSPGSISNASVSHDGKKVAIVLRGELFVASTSSERLVHVSRDSGVRYRQAVFTTDSTHVYGLSDKSGELEWWKLNVDGSGAPEQLSNGPALLRSDAVASPDGAWLMHGDYDDRVWLVSTKDGSTTKIAEMSSGDAVFSPDSKTVVYSHQMDNQMSALFAYDIAKKTTVQITSDRFQDSSPAFSADGNWLYFVSSRTWNSSVGSPWGERAPQPHFENRQKIYAIPLKTGLVFPLGEEDGLVVKSEPTGETRWDLGHLLQEVPVPAGNLSIAGVTEKRLIYRESRAIHAIDLKRGAEPVEIQSGIGLSYLSGDGKVLLIFKDDGIHLVPSSSGKGTTLDSKTALKLGGWKFAINKRAEWNQIYSDMWRLHRDYFWDPNMGGVDWEAMRDKYAVLLPRVGSREALADLQGMLVSELSLLHSNAGGGDVETGDNSVAPAALGGVFERDAKTGGYLLTRRFEADPDLPDMWSPLAHGNANVVEGEIILEVNGQLASTAYSMGQLLMDQAGKQVHLLVLNPKGVKRDVAVTPISGRAEMLLRYNEWEVSRRQLTHDASNGAIGYVHLQAMGSTDIGQWTREFYSQTNKQGMIIDVRHNRGGNIDSWVLSQLLRKGWAYFKGHGDLTPPNMQFSFNGHLVILVDERSASDGEAVADGFRRLGLGKAIGVRTWGGEVWLSGSNTQVDGGVTRASETGVFSPEGEWLIEGWGFVPDIEVDNLPHATYNGHDAQLEAAIKHLQQLIAEDPRLVPEPPPYPVLIPGSGFPTPWRSN